MPKAIPSAFSPSANLGVALHDGEFGAAVTESRRPRTNHRDDRQPHRGAGLRKAPSDGVSPPNIKAQFNSTRSAPPRSALTQSSTEAVQTSNLIALFVEFRGLAEFELISQGSYPLK
jgi:hypothetical protein